MALPRRVAVAALACAVLVLLAAIGALAVTTADGPPRPGDPPEVRGLEDLHAAGYTGTNASIGVVGVTGFDRAHPAIADQVVAARAFGPGATVTQGGHSDHGTAAATVAAETAPDAGLYLASFETQGGYERAVQWLLANDVDVVVTPVSFYGAPGDGSTRVSRVATDAVQQDAVFVAAAGNLAERHWRTTYDAVDDGRLVVDDAASDSVETANGAGSNRTIAATPGPNATAAESTAASNATLDTPSGRDAGITRNYLHGEGGHVTVWLSWESATGDGATADGTPADRTSADAGDEDVYTVELYRDAADPAAGRTTPERVATSRAFTRDDVANQRLEADVEGGRYFVVVRGPERPTGDRLRLTSPTHEFEHATPRGSLVAPATAEATVSVGAFDADAGRVEPFSSRGPTADGRLGIDVVAPARHDVTDDGDPFVGTSAAAPYVGGVAALVRDVDPDRSPREIEHALEATARDVAPAGPDPAAGYGRIDPYRAVRALAEERPLGADAD